MQGYSFDTFKTHAGNREALDACRAIASLAWEPGRPVVLVGPEGSGKSHLLWSMVKEVRARPDKVGLALIMAHEFPEKVKDLVHDPRPIQGPRPAMLLVDGLEGFREECDALEAVVQVFLRSERHVVLTSDVHPDRLIRLSPQFRALLNRSHTVEIRAAAPEPESPVGNGERVAALEKEVKILRAERDQLDKRLAASEVSSTEVESLRALVRSGLVEQDRLRAELDAALEHGEKFAAEAAEERAALRLERDALKNELQEQANTTALAEQAECDSLREKLEQSETTLTTAQAECAALRGRIVDLEAAVKQLQRGEASIRAEAESALAEQARLQGQLGRIPELEQALAEACAEREAAQEGNRRLADHAEAILQQIERKKSELSDTQQGLLASFQQLLYDFHAHGLAAGGVTDRERLEALLGDADNLADAFRHQMAVDRKRFEEQLERARHEGDYAGSLLEETRAEQGRLRIALDRAVGRAEALEREVAKARRQMVLQVAEMDALRHEAATQVAQAQSQAGELEARVAHLEAEVDAARTAGGEIARLGERLGGLAALTEELRLLTGRWSRLGALDADPEAPAGETLQENLFDAFEVVPQPPTPGPNIGLTHVPPAKPTGLPSLVELVEEAFSTDTDTHRSE
jgi:energy-coupling factor transporter ATP-binding protein EcfA2